MDVVVNLSIEVCVYAMGNCRYKQLYVTTATMRHANLGTSRSDRVRVRLNHLLKGIDPCTVNC